jgi:hypothetical protein
LRGEVALGEKAAELREIPGHRALVEAGAALRADRAQRFCEAHVAQHASGSRGSSLRQEDRLRSGVELGRGLLDPA